MDHKRGSFSGKIGFVLSAAGASVGLGNIWRFPYLAAKYGGAIFLLVYIILAMTFGYTMIIAETSIGRMTGKSPVGAYKSFSDKPALRVGGWINAIIPILIVPYYSVIGGWVIKYLAEYLMGKAHLVAEDGYFSSFISNGVSSELCFLVFTAMTLAIIFAGVENGIERVSKIMMPILVVLSLVISVYSVTRPGALEGVTDADLSTAKGQMRALLALLAQGSAEAVDSAYRNFTLVRNEKNLGDGIRSAVGLPKGGFLDTLLGGRNAIEVDDTAEAVNQWATKIQDAVNAASSATGRSLVPAQAMATTPSPSGAGMPPNTTSRAVS